MITIPRTSYTVQVSRLEYEQLRRENAELRAVILQLKEEISLLKGSKNSRTSSIAPSHDHVRSNSISLRTSSGKKPGGQSGHVGYTLPLSTTPDEIIDHHPCICTHCGEGLENVDSASFSRRQLVELPPVEPIYTEHRSYTCTVHKHTYKNLSIV